MNTAQDFVKVAMKEIGTKENPPNSNKVKYNTWYYGKPVVGTAYPWCMVFVQWCANVCGIPLPAKTASCSALMNAAKKTGQWVTSNYRVGDIAIFDFSGKRSKPAHTGIIQSVSADCVQCVEGNTGIGNDANGGAVMLRKRNNKLIIGAVRPKFAEEVNQKDEDEDMTQEQFNKMFSTAMSEYRKSLQDNDAGTWSKESREWASNVGLIQGSNTGNFMWEDFLTREQAASLMHRLYNMVSEKGK